MSAVKGHCIHPTNGGLIPKKKLTICDRRRQEKTKATDAVRRCAGQIFQPASIIRIRRLFGCIVTILCAPRGKEIVGGCDKQKPSCDFPTPANHGAASQNEPMCYCMCVYRPILLKCSSISNHFAEICKVWEYMELKTRGSSIR